MSCALRLINLAICVAIVGDLWLLLGWIRMGAVWLGVSVLLALASMVAERIGR
jgi:hypothetical protein